MIEHLIRTLAADGVRIHVWPCAAGYQANVSEPGSTAWTCHTAADPIEAVQRAMSLRAARVPDRTVEYGDGQQLDIEDAIDAADDFEELL